MPSVSLFGAAPRVTNIVLRQQFTGDGSDTTFQLTSGGVGNCTFNKGSWSASNIQTAYPAHVTGTDKKPTYDSIVILLRNRVGVSSIDANGLVTLDYAPRNGVNFYVWYWYNLQPIDEIDTYREDFVASMEAEAAAHAGEIVVDTTNFDGIMSGTDTTLQVALETIDDHLHDGQTLQMDGINSNGGAFAFTTTGVVTHNQPLAITNAGFDLDTYGANLNFVDISTFAVTTSDNAYNIFGLYVDPEFDATAAGYLYGARIVPKLTSGTISIATGLQAGVDLDAGTVTSNVYGIGFVIDQEAGNTISGDAYTMYALADFDGTVTGTSYMLYMYELNGVDYGIYQNGSAPNVLGGNLTIGTIAAGTADYDAFLVSDSGLVKYRTGAEVASDIGAGDGGHFHDGDTLQLDGVNSDGGAFSFTTTGAVTFSQTVNLDTVGTDEYQIGGNRALAMPVDNTNIAIGYQAGNSMTTGAAGNLAIGYQTLAALTTDNFNVAIGYQTANALTGSRDVALGYQAMLYSTTSEDCAAFGFESMQGSAGSSVGGQNTAFGYRTLYSYQDAAANTAIGASAMRSLTSGQYNVAIGSLALDGAVDVDSNVAIGYLSLSGVLTGNSSVAVGSETMKVATSAALDVAIGREACEAITTAQRVTGVGYRVLNKLTEGHYTTGVGSEAGFNLTTSQGNVAIGYRALYYNRTGPGNVAVGREAMFGASAQDNDYNIALGYRALYAITIGNNNTCLGTQAGDVITTGSGNIIIGYQIDPSAAGASNELNIGDTLYGDLSNGYIGIGKMPTARLELNLSTEDLQIVDAGSAGATEQDWIEVTVGGNTGYIRVYAAV